MFNTSIQFPLGSNSFRNQKKGKYQYRGQATPGEVLREQRINHGHGLDEVASQIDIPVKLLAALEEDQWELLPGEVVARGMLRNYATFLALDPNQMVRLRRETAMRVLGTELSPWGHSLGYLAIACLVALIVGIGSLTWNSGVLSRLNQSSSVPPSPTAKIIALAPTFTATTSPTTPTPTHTTVATNTPLPTNTTIPSTSTPVPTDTPLPTNTPVPTDTPLPTNTPVPTDTPLPTNTPVPTDTPLPTALPTNTLIPSPTFTATPAYIEADCTGLKTVITWPREQEIVSGLVEVRGSILLDNLNFYKLEIAPEATPNNFVYVDGKGSKVSENVLGLFNSGAVVDGTYILRAVAVDNTGNFPKPCVVKIVVQNQ